ncbi:MAG: class I SAM-dependent methyltransferase [Candidatus Omnitrophica bacterium]|nr:class I SAM-dependent methyltransferase [Candidatus Omnitrophota bacterium]
MSDQKIVDPNLYDLDYYYRDNEGCHEYAQGLDNAIHPKYRHVLEMFCPRRGDEVLDVGCGRGELLYYCAKKGAHVLGLDYSRAAIEIARQTIQMLPVEIRPFVKAEMGDVAEYDFPHCYDLIFMLDVFEHMNDDQLERTFEKFKKILDKDGKIVITTPNLYYEKYLQPIKMALDLPFRFLKWAFRVLRGKYRPKSVEEFLRNALKVRVVGRGEAGKALHVNVSTPRKIKTMLKDFKVDIWCEDPSWAPISLITKKWWGRQIVAIARR